MRNIKLVGQFKGKLALLASAALLCVPDVAIAQSQVDEIIVTARKKEESLQDTPISIQAFDAKGIERRNIVDISQIGEFTPNLRFDKAAAIGGSNSSAVLYIRGIGTDAGIPTLDLGVGTYVDGVYLARSVGGVLDLVDTERVEVLRGPQGTLFGRNTIGGAINITSKKPTNEFEGDVAVSVGSDALVNVRGRLNLPLVEDKLAARGAIMFKKRDGYVTRTDGTDMGNQDSVSARLALRWTPTDAVTFDLAGDYTSSESNGAPFVLLDVTESGGFAGFHNNVFNPVFGGGTCATGPNPTPTNDPNCFNTQFVDPSRETDAGTLAPRDDLDIWGVSLTGEFEASDNIILKSITSYRDTESAFALDQDHSPHTIAHVETVANQNQFSQELQVLGDFLGGRLDTIAGVYYFEEEGLTVEDIAFAPVTFQSGGEFDNSSVAVFGQGTYDLTEDLSFTGGIRYTDDKKGFTPNQFLNTAFINPMVGFMSFPPGAAPVVPSVPAEVSFDKVTLLGNLSYQVTDDVLTYATYSQGFKSGGFTQRLSPQDGFTRLPSYEPETVDVYEAGFKTTMFDRRVRLNGAFFYTDYSDLQIVVQFNPETQMQSVGPVVLNAAEATIKGFELDLTATPIDGLLLEASLGYVDAGYDGFEFDEALVGVSVTDKIVKTPKWSSALGMSYRIPVSDSSYITPRVDWTYSGSYFNNAINSPQIFQDSYHLINLGIAYDNEDNGWGLSLAGKNLTDEKYISAGFSDVVNLGTHEAVFDRGSEWILTVKKSFN